MLGQLQRSSPLPLAPPQTTPPPGRKASIDTKSPLNIVRPSFPKPPVSTPAYEAGFGHARSQSQPGGPQLPPSKKRSSLLEVPTRQRRISASSSPTSPAKERPWERAAAAHLHTLHTTSSSGSLARTPRQPSPLIFTPELYDGHVPVTLLDGKPLPRTASQASLSPQSSMCTNEFGQSKSQTDLPVPRVESSSKLSKSSKRASSSKGLGALKDYAKSLFHGDDVVVYKAPKPSDNSDVTPNTLLLNNFYNGNNLPPGLEVPADTIPAARPRPPKAGQSHTVGSRKSIFSIYV